VRCLERKQRGHPLGVPPLLHFNRNHLYLLRISMASRCARWSAVQRRLGALERVLGKGTDEARTILRGLMGEITLKPTRRA
jgi:hypothetical protein